MYVLTARTATGPDLEVWNYSRGADRFAATYYFPEQTELWKVLQLGVASSGETGSYSQNHLCVGRNSISCDRVLFVAKFTLSPLRAWQVWLKMARLARRAGVLNLARLALESLLEIREDHVLALRTLRDVLLEIGDGAAVREVQPTSSYCRNYSSGSCVFLSKIGTPGTVLDQD